MLEWQNIEIHQHHTILTFRTFKLLSQILWTLSSVILATARWGKHYQHFNYVCKSWGQDTWPAWHRSEGRVCVKGEPPIKKWVGQWDKACVCSLQECFEAMDWNAFVDTMSDVVHCVTISISVKTRLWQRSPPEFIPQFIKMVLNKKK